MAFPELKVGRQPVTLYELDQDFCTLVYGESPCTAELGVTGERKCFNTRVTCQDPQNYDRGTLTLTFAKPHVDQPRDRNWIPLLQDVDTVPTKINVGGGDRSSEPLGQRASVTAVFKDAPHSDLLVDPYRDERDYNALDRGTFWSKWTRRNPYYQNRRVRVREGYVGQDPEEMRTRHYFIDRIDGPDSSGRVRIKAKDVLKLADNDRAQWPEQSPGELDAEIGETDSSLTIRRAEIADYDPDGQGSGTVRVGDEIILWGSISESDGIVTLSSLTRGAERTEADDHDEGDTVQRCQRYTNAALTDVLDDILTKGSNVPSEFIPMADWDAERDRWLSGFNVSVLLTEPFGATELLAELTEQCLFYIWWDERDQEIKFKAVRPVDFAQDEAPVVIDDESGVIGGTFEIEQNPEERVSQVWTLFSQIDPTEDVDEFDNYRRIRIFADARAESDDEYGEQRIRRVYARWLQGDAQAITVNRRIIARYRDNPVRVRLALDAKDRDLKTADIVDLSTRQLQDDTGAQETRRFQVIRAKETEPGHRQDYVLQRFEFVGRYAFFMENDAPVYSNSMNGQRESGGFFAADGDGFDDGTEAYRFI